MSDECGVATSEACSVGAAEAPVAATVGSRVESIGDERIDDVIAQCVIFLVAVQFKAF
mgnify:CR=1 FL=1